MRLVVACSVRLLTLHHFRYGLATRVPGFEFVPVLSDPDRFVHEAADEFLESGGMSDPELYMCGPPPMIDAMIEVATEKHGIDEDRVFHDKFTTSADAAVA